MGDIQIIYRSMKPHSKKPFPKSFYDNWKIRPRHIFIFDVLCRHLDQDAEGWIKTDSKEIIKLVKVHNGLKVEAITAVLSTLRENGYIHMIWNQGERSALERIWTKTDYLIQIDRDAWTDKEPVKPVRIDPAIRRNRYLLRGK